MSQFIYLLNAFEQASQADNPANLGYGTKRAQLIEYVTRLEDALALRPEDALRLPLRNLMKESAAMLALCEPQLREAAGNTNVAVFLQRITEAAEAFEQHAPQKEQP